MVATAEFTHTPTYQLSGTLCDPHANTSPRNKNTPKYYVLTTVSVIRDRSAIVVVVLLLLCVAGDESEKNKTQNRREGGGVDP